eukprot:s434_g2.t1
MAPKETKSEQKKAQQTERDADEIEQNNSGYGATIAMASSDNPATWDDQAIAEALTEEVMVVSEKGGHTLNVSDAVFDPYNPDVDLETLSVKFSGLNLKEQKMVLGALKEAQSDLKGRLEVMNGILPSDAKKVQKVKKDGTSERFLNINLALVVVIGDKEYDVSNLFTRDRIGTLRQKLVDLANYPKKTQFVFSKDGVRLSPQNAGTYLYTVGLKSGDRLVAVVDDDNDANDKKDDKKNEVDALTTTLSSAKSKDIQKSDDDEEKEEDDADASETDADDCS